MSTETTHCGEGFVAGWEVNLLVSDLVMGQPYAGACRTEGPVVRAGNRLPTCPHYSTDIAAAWLVVEEMRRRWAKQENAKRGEPDVWCFHDFADEGWRASVVWLHHDGAIVEVDEIAPTLPLAICRAALAALAAPPPVKHPLPLEGQP